ncbi:MAG: hypothetical protein J1F12_04325 [Muribaculaceae bacterium]|nr:hypothetical protein [Muribaculaceae bacterium]
MKKIIVLTLLLTVCTLPGYIHAVSYRGFLEVSGTIDPNQKFPAYPQYLGQFYTTHGLQVSEMFFVGIGAGAIVAADGDNSNLHFLEDSIYPGLKELASSGGDTEFVPIFFDVRWDGFGLLNNGSKIVPFVDLKAGYSLFTRGVPSLYEEYQGYSYKDADLNFYKSGLYMQPTIGMRVRFSRYVGFNIGLTYNLLPGKVATDYSITEKELTSEWGDTNTCEIFKINKFKNKLIGSFGILIGVDF